MFYSAATSPFRFSCYPEWSKKRFFMKLSIWLAYFLLHLNRSDPILSRLGSDLRSSDETLSSCDLQINDCEQTWRVNSLQHLLFEIDVVRVREHSQIAKWMRLKKTTTSLGISSVKNDEFETIFFVNIIVQYQISRTSIYES